jgi:hypothetical protein
MYSFKNVILQGSLGFLKEPVFFCNIKNAKIIAAGELIVIDTKLFQEYTQINSHIVDG